MTNQISSAIEAAANAMISHPFDGNYLHLAEVALEAAGVPLLIKRTERLEDALKMIAKYAPSRPASDLGLSSDADASWAIMAGQIAKKTLEEIDL